MLLLYILKAQLFLCVRYYQVVTMESFCIEDFVTLKVV